MERSLGSEMGRRIRIELGSNLDRGIGRRIRIKAIGSGAWIED